MPDITDYKITAFDQTNGRLEIKFENLEHKIHLDLHPDQSGLYPEGDKLDTMIRGVFPKSHIERKEKIASGIANSSAIASLVQQDDISSYISDISPTPQSLNDFIDPDQLFNVKLVVAIQRTLAQISGGTV
jgi:hypothetical protein